WAGTLASNPSTARGRASWCRSRARSDDGGGAAAVPPQLDRGRRFHLAAHVAEGAGGQLGRRHARERTHHLAVDHDLGPHRRPPAVDLRERAQEPVDVAAAVDTTHELLADEAALRERHRVLLEERL